MSSTYPIGMNPKLILPMLAEKPLWTVSGGHITTKVYLRILTIIQVNIGRARRKLLISFFVSMFFFIYLVNLGAGDIEETSRPKSTITFCLCKVITLSLCKYIGFWPKAFLCHSNKKKIKVLNCLKTAPSPVINNCRELLSKCLLS